MTGLPILWYCTLVPRYWYRYQASGAGIGVISRHKQEEAAIARDFDGSATSSNDHCVSCPQIGA